MSNCFYVSCKTFSLALPNNLANAYPSRSTQVSQSKHALTTMPLQPSTTLQVIMQIYSYLQLGEAATFLKT